MLRLFEWDFSYLKFYSLFFGIFYDIAGYLIIFIIVNEQKKNLSNNNIDSLSLILLLLFHTSAINMSYSAEINKTIALVNSLIAIIFIVIFIKSKDKVISRFSIKQVFVYLIGLIIGISIAIFKIQLNNSDLFSLALANPIPFINSITISLSNFAIREEFIYRGIIWGYLRRKGINEWWIIVISSLLWGFGHIYLYRNIPELINFVGLGLIFGFLVKKAKSINISIGAHAGYSSFLVLKDILLYK